MSKITGNIELNGDLYLYGVGGYTGDTTGVNTAGLVINWLANEIMYSVPKKNTIYVTDGTTGLLGHNGSSVDNQWQLTGLTLSGYSYIKCYFCCGTATGDSRTPAIVVDVPLDCPAGPTGYIGSAMVPLPFNRNREYLISCAVDSTKTKFQVIHQNTLWDISVSDANNNGRYCYKIEGYY